MKYYILTDKLRWKEMYDIYNEKGAMLYVIQTSMSNMVSHRVAIVKKGVSNLFVAVARERRGGILPRFELFANQKPMGDIVRTFSFGAPKYEIANHAFEVRGVKKKGSFSIYRNTEELVAVQPDSIFQDSPAIMIDCKTDENIERDLLLAAMVDIMRDLNSF